MLADPIMQRIDRSIQFNFRHEGRPDKWKKSHRAAALDQITLTDTGNLKNSLKLSEGGIEYKDLKITVGTNVSYAQIHQEGGTINNSVTVRAHERKINRAWGELINERTVKVKEHKRHMNAVIPARPYIMLQDSDKSYIKKKIEKATQQLFNKLTLGTATSSS